MPGLIPVFCFALCAISGCNAQTEEKQSFNWPAMGTYANLILADGTAAERDSAFETVKRTLAEIEAELSVFSPSSAVSALNAAGSFFVPGGGAAPGGHLLNVAEASVEFHRMSGGAFNPMVAPLVELWGFDRGGAGAARPDFPPSDAAVSSALALCDFNKFSIARANGTAGRGSVLTLPRGAKIDFGGIAKGYAVDAAYEALRAAGRTDFLMNLGGNMRAGGAREWLVAVRHPRRALGEKPLGHAVLTDGMAVATSGGYEQFIETNGVRHCHIIDPRTGRPARGMEQTTALARSAMAADALSTACFVRGYMRNGPGWELPAESSTLYVIAGADRKMEIVRDSAGDETRTLHNAWRLDAAGAGL